jgi:tetratricopeptide (TPR) repeat protein
VFSSSPIFPALLIPAFFLLSCAGPENTPPSGVSPQPDPHGFSSRYNQEAQKLFARARIMWDLEENCSDPELALEYLDAAIVLEENYAEAYMRRALAASETGEWESAFADSSRAIRLQPAADHYASRALIFIRQGNYLGAAKDLEQALRLDAGNPRTAEFLRRLERLKQ